MVPRGEPSLRARIGGDPGPHGESAEGRRLQRAAFERVAAAEDAYWERCTGPARRAAAALASTPAPDLAAVRAKIGAVRALEQHELEPMERDWFGVIDGDLGRLG